MLGVRHHLKNKQSRLTILIDEAALTNFRGQSQTTQQRVLQPSLQMPLFSDATPTSGVHSGLLQLSQRALEIPSTADLPQMTNMHVRPEFRVQMQAYRQV